MQARAVSGKTICRFQLSNMHEGFPPYLNGGQDVNVEQKVLMAKRGDQTAFTELILEKKSSLYRIAYSYTRNREDAFDVVSDAVYKAYLSLNKLNEPSQFYTWLTRILINCALNLRKANGRLVLIDKALSRETDAREDQDALIDLYQAIDTLGEPEKTIIILKYLEDMTIEQVAAVMNSPVGTIKTRLNRALQELRLELKEAVI
ncbi:MAG: RNA polymerase sigma factor SigV [Firmicutes bacterium]|nr:RNA polymerase sigma factor SigV [Bacillota bacterium]